ncbi:MAG: CPBP family intramembrane metalloprotease [Clostridiales bacterium]|nr:CPBP family intramembrane metalloprotease [Clostridiales bacterium]MCF8022777.1 CPBP family intramembrane metalloprotease [Clostridiales bacterium]
MNESKIELENEESNLKRGFLKNKQIIFYCLYGIILTLAELVVGYGSVKLGIFLHILLLGLLIVHTSFLFAEKMHLLYLALVLAPLTRIMSLSMPLGEISPIYWYLVISAPLFASGIGVMRIAGFSPGEVGLHLNKLPVQLLISLIGFPLGVIEYVILRPGPMVSSLAFSNVWFPALVLIICTGLLEEFIFRGIMYRAALEAVGKKFALFYVSFIFAVLHITHLSFTDVIFVFCVALLFTGIFMQQRSIVGLTLAHGITNITLYIICPLII